MYGCGVLFILKARSSSELSLVKGDHVKVTHDRGGGWLYGKSSASSLSGFFPADFVSEGPTLNHHFSVPEARLSNPEAEMDGNFGSIFRGGFFATLSFVHLSLSNICTIYVILCSR